MDFMSGTREEFSVYSVGPEVKLDGFIAWYPLPGHQHVYLKSDNEDRPPKYVYLGWEFGRMRYSFGEMKLEVEGYPVPLYTGMQELERRPATSGLKIDRAEHLPVRRSVLKEIRRNDLPITVVTTPYLEKASVLMPRYAKSMTISPSGTRVQQQRRQDLIFRSRF